MAMIGAGHFDDGAGGYGAVIPSYNFIEKLFIRLKSTPNTFIWHADIHRYIILMCVCMCSNGWPWAT